LPANVSTVPAGAPFLPTLARALLSGELVPGFPSADPLDLARATVYLPTQRAASAFARELVKASGKATLILPRIAPLGVFEPLSPPEAADEEPGLEDRPAVGELARRMTLAELIRAWGRALQGAIRHVGPDGRLVFDVREAPLVAGTPAQAFALAADLAALIDDMIIDDVAPARLATLAPEPYDRYWGITLDFLKIAFDAWPKWLDAQGLVDRAARTAARVDEEIAGLASGAFRGPVVIAGSTGANRATARLIGAIARAANGAVVLPDLDLDLDDASFATIGRPEAEAGPTAGHPQALLSRLIGVIGVERSDIRRLGDLPPPLRARALTLSEALRPADTTALWPERRAAIGAEAMREGLAGLSLIVAENENEEALALAVAMREVLETPGRTAALVTPEATLARRVAAELARWGVEVENSTGRMFRETRTGALARLALAAARDFSPKPLAALLNHPHVGFGEAARVFELALLRSTLPASGLEDVAAVLAAARKAQQDAHAHRAIRALGETDFVAAEQGLVAMKAALAPLRELPREAPLKNFLAAHRKTLVALTQPYDLLTTPEGQELDAWFEEWALAAGDGFAVGLSDYAQVFESALAGRAASPPSGGHPRLKILGLLEARLLRFDLVLLGGLDETVWPPAAETDPFLNRGMRAEIGLSSPERRIGQTAHDFVSALGAREAILSRAKKRGGSPTVASRFLQRLGAVAGEEEMAALATRGAKWLEWARQLDRPEATRPSARPEPRPALDLRPTRLSVTRVEALRRDPYSVYAESVLGLQTLPPVGAEAGPREIGVVWHAALQVFAEEPAEPDLEQARATLLDIAEREFAALLADPAFRALSWPRIVQGLEKFVEFDAQRRELAKVLYFEVAGKLTMAIPGAPNFTLTARADRIEILHSGGAAIVDYKTGTPPSDREVGVGFAPQLTLEAAMLARGAFDKIGREDAESLIYFKLGGADGGGKPRALKPPAGETLVGLVERHFAGLQLLIFQFAQLETPYLPRPFPKFTGRGSDYDHLARVKEWAAAEDEGGEG